MSNEPQLRQLVIWPDKKLHSKCLVVRDFDYYEQLIDDMKHTLTYHQGLGLAAPQVGELVQIIIVQDNQGHLIPMINPQITQSSEQITSLQEGCLSIPGYYEHRTRPYHVNVDYYDRDGNKKQFDAYGTESFIVQHEIDHLHGKLFIDNLSRLKIDRIKKKVQKNK